MAYRNGTYIAFHAEGSTDPTASDIRYYRMLKAWHANDGTDFRFVNSHEKVKAVSDAASKQRIMESLQDRLDNSKNMVLIIGDKTKDDTDFVPFEIRYAVDVCKIPIIGAYTGYTSILNPGLLRPLWPAALASRIDNGKAGVLHIAFKQSLIDDAIGQFSHVKFPKGRGLGYYSKEAQVAMGVQFN